MFRRYRTDYSNQVHQLVVAVSRHLYVTASGKFQHQKKPFESHLERRETFTKRHVVHYLVRDHFSGLFYAEITDTENMFSAIEFLYRAWTKKNTHPLYGLPDALTVPKGVRVMWPNMVPFLETAKIQPLDVTSGFQGGVRDLRTWEDELRCSPYDSGYPPNYEEVLSYAPSACVRINESEYRGTPKSTLWREHLPENFDVASPEEWFAKNERGT